MCADYFLILNKVLCTEQCPKKACNHLCPSTLFYGNLVVLPFCIPASLLWGRKIPLQAQGEASRRMY